MIHPRTPSRRSLEPTIPKRLLGVALLLAAATLAGCSNGPVDASGGQGATSTVATPPQGDAAKAPGDKKADVVMPKGKYNFDAK
jgi:hypothetical protein